jgi:hypothetical protein
VIHPLTMLGWLGSGGALEKYLKRPICFVLTFDLAHLSTFRYKRRWIALDKRLSCGAHAPRIAEAPAELGERSGMAER